MKTFSLLSSTLIFAQASAYSIDDYLKESESRDPSLKAVVYSYEAAELSTRRSEQVTGIRLFSDATFYDDTRPVANPSFQGSRTSEWKLGLGLTQQNPWGFNWSLSQNVKKTKIFGTNPGTLPQTEYYDFYPMAELSVPLWRNFLGAEVRAQRDLLDSSSQIQKYQAQIDRETKFVDIEKAYYCYGIQQNLLELAKKNLERSERFYKSISNRRRQNLVDDSDQLQARASLSLRKLEHDRATRELRVCKATFNSYRNLPETETPPKLSLELLNPAELRSLASKKKVSLFDKIRVLQADSQINQARVDSQAAAPKLDLKGSVTLQGRDDTLSDSYSDMNDQKRNLWTVGVSLNTPLDFTLTRDLKRAADFSERAATERLKRSATDQELSWISEQENLLRCAESLDLLRDLEDSQRKRLSAEERKYRNGRSTLFLLLSAEQDLVNAESQKWASELQCRVVKAQTRLYSEEG